MGNAKVVYGTTVLVDLTSDTVDAAHLLSGYTAHGADGEAITGTRIAEPDDVTFWDTDGTPLYTYSNTEALALTALPAVPSKTDLGLVADGWNWTLTDIQNQIAHCPGGTIDIGPHYKHSDGGTSVWVDLSSGNKTLILRITLTGYSSSKGVTVDFGDGSSSRYYASSNTVTHTYSENTVVKVHVTNDSGVTYRITKVAVSPLTVGSSSATFPKIIRIALGDGYAATVTGSAADSLFTDSSSMYELISPSDMTSSSWYLFMDDHNKCNIIPRSCTVGSGTVLRQWDHHPNIEYVVCLPYTHPFNPTYAVASKRLTIPYGGGATAFNTGSYEIFYKKIGIPDCITSVYLPYTAMTEELVIPSSVTAIAGASYNRHFNKLKFKGTTPPTAESAFYINPSCVIAVPTGYLSAYTSATNYPDSASYTYIEED